MAYTVVVTLFDFGPIFPSLPSYSGSLFNTPLGPSFDTASAMAPSATLTFPIPPPTPLVPMALHVTDGAAGDLFRSGLVVLPPSAASLSLVTASGGISSAALPAMTARLTGVSVPVSISELPRVVIGVFGFGFIPPSSITITAATVVPGTGTLALTITGAATYRWMFIIPVTSAFTYTTTLTVLPSGDPFNRGRIVRVTTAGSTLTFTDPLLSGLSALVGVLDAEVIKRVETLLSAAMVTAVDTFLTGRGSVRTGSSVISARRIVITPGGVTLQIGLADFSMPVTTAPVSTAMRITIAPQPVDGVLQSYSIKVATIAGAPVPSAAVTLTNYQSRFNANVTTTNLAPTDAQGKTTFSGTLRGYHREAAGRVVEVHRYPRLTASAAGFQSATLELVMESLI